MTSRGPRRSKMKIHNEEEENTSVRVRKEKRFETTRRATKNRYEHPRRVLKAAELPSPPFNHVEHTMTVGHVLRHVKRHTRPQRNHVARIRE